MHDITTHLDAIEHFLQQEGDVLLARHREQAPCDTTAPLEAALWTARDAVRAQACPGARAPLDAATPR